MRQQSVLSQLKNKLSTRDRIDFFKKMGHGKKVNVCFIENICEYFIIYSKNSMQPMRVVMVLIVAATRRRNKLILEMKHYFVVIDIGAIINICFMVWTTGFNMLIHPKDCHLFCCLFNQECFDLHGFTFCFESKLDFWRVEVPRNVLVKTVKFWHEIESGMSPLALQYLVIII